MSRQDRSQTFTSPSVLVASLSELARQRRTIVAIAGPPGAGKSTFAERLRHAVDAGAPGSAQVLPGDGYHFDDLLLNARGWRPRKGAPHTSMSAASRRCWSGFAPMPRTRSRCRSSTARSRSPAPAQGSSRAWCRWFWSRATTLLLDRAPWSSLAPLFDATIMLTAPLEILRQRLLERWREIGLSGADLTAKMEGNDLQNVATVLQGSRAADHLVDATLAWMVEAEEPAGPRAGSQARG